MINKLTTLLLVPILLVGCGLGGKNQANQQSGQGPNVQQIQRVPQTVKEKVYNQDSQATAKRLVEIADKVPNVQRSTAMVVGKTAIVGINVDDKLDRPRVGTIKYTVAQ